MGLIRSWRLVLSLLVLGIPCTAIASVVFTGTVTPSDPSGVTSTTTVTVGPTSSTPADADPRGGIEVNGGSQFVAGRVLVGDSDPALAKMLVSGAGTKASVVADGSTGTPTLGVGRRGSGYLRIENGAWLQVGSATSGVLSIFPGGESQGLATVDVVGESSLLTIGRQLLVAEADVSTLNVRDGAVVRVGSINGAIDDAVLINGLANISGERTELQTNVLTVGSRQQSSPYGVGGVLRVSDGAIVRSTSSYSSSSRAYVGADGRIELDDGTLAYSRLELGGELSGSGKVSGSVVVGSTGEIEVGEGDLLQINSTLELAGRVRVLGGQLELNGLSYRSESNSYRLIEVERGGVTVKGYLGTNGLDDGVVRLRDSTFTVDNAYPTASHSIGGILAERSIVRLGAASAYYSRGKVELIDSELIVNRGLTIDGASSDTAYLLMDGSRIRSEGAKSVDALTVNDLLVVRGQNNSVDVPLRTNGVIDVADGASIALASADLRYQIHLGAGSSVRFSEQATIFSEIAMALSDSNLTTPSVVGEKRLNLGNKLTVDVSAVSEIAAGQEFALFEADLLSASFSTYSFPDLPGTLEFVPQLTDTEFSLLVVDAAVTLPGDFNADGCVDAADYTAIRDSGLETANPLAMVTWQTNYGRWLPESGAPIPEPTAVVLIGLGFAMKLPLIAASRR